MVLWTRCLLAVALLLAAWGPAAQPVQAQSDVPTQVRRILEKMTPEERVGQLFLVTFKGRQTGLSSSIYDLIVNHHVGGVVLRAGNDNFTGPDGTVGDTYQLINELQKNAWSSSQMELVNTATSSVYTPQFIPLFVGLSQDGDGPPYDQILNGLTPLPNQMAIGSTWDPGLAQSVGAALGQELSALGINLLFGPSLDVLDVVQAETGEDLGTRTFGGDPYWVGEMGKAYISGLHAGSNHRLAVIAKNFPGRGGSDRPPQEEVATVRKSLEQLKQIELAPFFAVTGSAPNEEARADGLLASHIRYQGFQGNIRATTRPVSFDPAAFEQIMGLPQFQSWRDQGGIVISDDLGSQAVRRFFDPTGQAFDARQVARSAFLAGNDVLYLDNFIASGDADTYTTIVRTLEFFATKYREDVIFAQRVDASVTRILTIKLRMYGAFSLEAATPPVERLIQVGKSQEVVFQVAQRAATLLSPDPTELNVSLPRPPDILDRIVFITETVSQQQCSQCSTQEFFPASALESAVLRLYGPNAGAQVINFKLSSFSFMDLWLLLNGGAPEKTETLAQELKLTDWVVFSFMNTTTARAESQALRQLLAERPDLVRNKRVIVFAFNAPYYLDATDISKLTAYYALYSKQPAFVDMAARLLFQEQTAVGALPVSVSGLGYDLITAMSPDPTQVIPLMIDLNLPESEAGVPAAPTLDLSTPELTPTPEPEPTFKVGDSLPLKTGVIYDHNRHPVPDGTVVRFLFTFGGDSSTVQQIETTTVQGVARAVYRIQSPGLMDIRVTSDPAVVSTQLRLDVGAGQAAVVMEITPTLPTTPTIEPTETPTPTLEPTPTVEETSEPPEANTAGWLAAMLLAWGSGFGALYVGRRWLTPRWSLRLGLCVALGGLGAYALLLLLDAPQWSVEGLPFLRLVSFVGIGCLLGAGAAAAWRQLIRQRAQA